VRKRKEYAIHLIRYKNPIKLSSLPHLWRLIIQENTNAKLISRIYLNNLISKSFSLFLINKNTSKIAIIPIIRSWA
jgi:hypothetical protein